MTRFHHRLHLWMWKHDQRHLNELQNKVRVFAVEFGGEAVQAAAQPLLVDLHQLLALSVQFHTDAKLTLPVRENKEEMDVAAEVQISYGCSVGERTNLMSSIRALWRLIVLSD